MSKPITLTTNSFDQWRQNTNTISNNVGDPVSIYSTRGGGDSTPITQPTDVVEALNDLNTRKFNLTGGTVSGASTFSNTLEVTGNFTVNTNKLVVTAATGNTTIAGTLGVSLATTLSNTLAVTGDVSVNTNKFNITASNGNTLIAGTLGVTGATTLSNTANVVGDFSVNTNKFNVTAASGNTTIAGTLGVTGDVAINTNKFNVTAASGNTLIAGTLGVTGLITASGGMSGAITSSNVTITGGTINNTTIGASTPTTAIVTTLTANTAVYSDAVASRSTDTDLTLSGNGTGKVNVNDPLNVVGDFSVATNKFNVTAASGNTTIAGTLGVTGVATTGGLVADTLASKTTDTDLTLSGNGTGKVNVNDPLNVVGNFSVATNKMTVNATSGDSVVAGNLTVQGTTKGTGAFYTGTTAPTNTSRLNYDGNLYATNFYGNGANLTSLQTSLVIDVDAVTSAVTVAVRDEHLKFISATGVTISYNDTNNSLTFLATGLVDNSDANNNLRVGKNSLLGAWNGSALNSVDTAQALEIRPWSGSTLTNLLKVASDNSGSTTVFRIAAAGAVYASGVQNFTSGTASTAYTNGTVVITGGLGISGAINTNGAVTVKDNVIVDTGTVTGQNSQTLYSTSNKAMEFTVRCTKGTSYQITKLLVVHNGTDSWITEYGTVSNTTPFVTFSASIAAGTLSLLGDGGGTTDTVYKVLASVFKD